MILCDYDFVVFDCDGVILKSNQLKSDAFAKALEGEPERQIFEFVEYHKANGGISRYKKFAHYFNEMYPRPDADAAVEQALGKYAAIVKQGLMECELIGGVHAALSALQAAQIPCAVNSGGDEQELHQVFAARGLDQFFVHIFGSPTPKNDNMQRLKDHDFFKGRGVMLGDSKSDWQAASAFGLDFIYVQEESEWKDGAAFNRAQGHLVIENFVS